MTVCNKYIGRSNINGCAILGPGDVQRNFRSFSLYDRERGRGAGRGVEGGGDISAAHKKKSK